MLPRRPLTVLAAIACFIAALASVELGIWALTAAADDGVTAVDTSEEIRDDLPEEHAAPVAAEAPLPLPGDGGRALVTTGGIGPRHAHLRDVHRPPEA